MLNGCKSDVTVLLAAGNDVPLARASRMLPAASRIIATVVCTNMTLILVVYFFYLALDERQFLRRLTAPR